MNSRMRSLGAALLFGLGVTGSGCGDLSNTTHKVVLETPDVPRIDPLYIRGMHEATERYLNEIHQLKTQLALLQASSPGAPPPPQVVGQYRPRFLSRDKGCLSRVERLGPDSFRFSNVEGWNVIFDYDRNSGVFIGRNGTHAYLFRTGLLAFDDAGHWIPE
jgi:hypothetical protein